MVQKPQLLSRTERFASGNTAMADVVSIGLRRLARQDPEKALGLLDSYARRMAFSAEEKVAIARQIGLTLARRFDSRALQVMAEYDPELRDNTVSEWRARLLLRLGRWDDAYALTSRFPEDLAKTNRWRYWRARSLELKEPNSPQAISLYAPVAKERDFYGFLSADRIQAPYKLNHQPLNLPPKVMQKVRNTAGIRRALEFHARGQIVDGRREWYHVSRLFNRDELVAQAQLAYQKAGTSRRSARSARPSTGTTWTSAFRWPIAAPWSRPLAHAKSTPAGPSRSPGRKAPSWPTRVRTSVPPG